MLNTTLQTISSFVLGAILLHFTHLWWMRYRSDMPRPKRVRYFLVEFSLVCFLLFYVGTLHTERSENTTRITLYKGALIENINSLRHMRTQVSAALRDMPPPNRLRKWLEDEFDASLIKAEQKLKQVLEE